MPGYELIGDEELEQIRRIFESGAVLFRHGFDEQRGGLYLVRSFEDSFADKMQSGSALGVTSGTAALRVALASIGLRPGDEVVIPSFTFVATAEAVIEAGGIPVVAEIDETLNMDPKALREVITNKTAAVIVVHMLGTPAALEEVSQVCREREVDLIEDVAWGCGGSLNNRMLGSWGRVGAFSFDFAKTITTGEGGMVLFQNDDDYARGSAWHDHGHDNNPRFPRWEDTRSSSGFNFRMNELQGAVGVAQLAKLDEIVTRQRARHEELASAVSRVQGVTLRSEPDGARSTHDALIFETTSRESAIRCRDELLKIGFGTKILPEALTWHFAAFWDHMPALVEQYGNNLRHAFPASEARLARCVALPISLGTDGPSPQTLIHAIDRGMGRRS